MSRNDIADYLGLSVETVSRALTELRQRGILEFGGTRQLKIARPSDDLLSLPHGLCPECLIHGLLNRGKDKIGCQRQDDRSGDRAQKCTPCQLSFK